MAASSNLQGKYTGRRWPMACHWTVANGLVAAVSATSTISHLMPLGISHLSIFQFETLC